MSVPCYSASLVGCQIYLFCIWTPAGKWSAAAELLCQSCRRGFDPGRVFCELCGCSQLRLGKAQLLSHSDRMCALFVSGPAVPGQTGFHHLGDPAPSSHWTPVTFAQGHGGVSFSSLFSLPNCSEINYSVFQARRWMFGEIMSML